MMPTTAKLRPKVHDLNRRKFLLSAAAISLFPGKVIASSTMLSSDTNEIINWDEFQKKMMDLAVESSATNAASIVHRGLKYLKKLDIHSVEFKNAVKESYETGNRYWLWQRMIKNSNINGGILNIDSDQIVQLHDHPGASGLVRILSGETEVWNFDLSKEYKAVNGQSVVELTRTSHRILRAGDTISLTPNNGNIHTLRSLSKECSMLDFFIPPYQRSQRSWYEPLENDWFDKKLISCQKIPQHEYAMVKSATV